MTLPLGNDTAIVLKRTPGAKDRLNVPAMTTVPTRVDGCSFQSAAGNAETVTNDDLTVSRWVLYAPPVSVILSLTAIDAINIGGAIVSGAVVGGVTYEDFSDPHPWTDETGALDHVTIDVRKARG